MFKIDSTSTGILRRFISTYLGPYKKDLAITTVCMIISAGCYGLFTHMMQPLIDTILSTSSNKMLTMFALGLVGLFFIRGVTEFTYTYIMDRIGLDTIAKIQNEMYTKLVHQDLYFFRDHPSGDLASRFLFDLHRLRATMTQTITGAVRDSSMVVALVVNLFSKDWLLSVLVLFIFPPVIFLARRFGRRTRKYSNGIQTQTSELSSLLHETFSGIRQVQVYTMEKREASRVRDCVFQILHLMRKSAKVRAMTSPMVEFVAMINFAFVVVYAVIQVRSGNLTEGAFISFITSLLVMYRPIKGLSNINNSVQEALAVLERTFTLLDSKIHVTNKTGAKELKVNKGEVALQNIAFRYPNGQLALDGIHATIPSGKTVALVGASGAGKSTILNMMPRFFDPTTGSITIDGQDIKNVTIASLRNHISLVTQDVVLFNDTIYNNIAYGNEAASKEEIFAAAKAAAAHDFIEKLDDGYATKVGENGARLSGGQRQRIAIARALLKNAPILLLDEATSSLDTQSERQVQKALNRLMKGRTTLVVAHRLSTIVDADIIHVLDHGKIIETGTHNDLLKKDGAYAALWHMQSDGQASPETEGIAE